MNWKMGWVNRSMLQAALFYCQSLLNDMMIDDEFEDVPQLEQHKHGEFFKKNCFKAEYRLSSQLKEILHSYSLIDLPFT